MLRDVLPVELREVVPDELLVVLEPPDELRPVTLDEFRVL